MDELNRTAIIIVRNPFAAIIGHRHLVSEFSNYVLSIEIQGMGHKVTVYLMEMQSIN